MKMFKILQRGADLSSLRGASHRNSGVKIAVLRDVREN
jgi:hypothetical protein